MAKKKTNIVIVESKQELRSRETKAKIIQAAESLMNQHGYATMTIQNICATADVSTGTFYHYFKNKDNLLLCITMERYANHKSESADILKNMNSLEKLLDIYSCYVGCFAENGIEFTSDYVTIKSSGLLMRRKSVEFVAGHLAMHTDSGYDDLPWPLVDEDINLSILGPDSAIESIESISIATYMYIRKAQEDGYISDRIDPLELFYELDTIMFGAVFSWCQANGNFDVKERVQVMISKYLTLYAGDKMLLQK